MANVNSVQKAANVGQVGSGLAGGQFAWGVAEIASAQSGDDTVTFMTLPAGTTVLGGFLFGDDIDTGTETYELDIGDDSDPDRFLNSGVLSGDAVTGTKPEVGIMINLFGTLKDGPHTYTAETDIKGKVIAAANSGGTGTLYLLLFCTYGDPRVSPPDAPV